MEMVFITNVSEDGLPLHPPNPPHRVKHKEATTGFEPVNSGFADRRLILLATSPRSINYGAEDEIRTRDLFLGKEAFYH